MSKEKCINYHPRTPFRDEGVESYKIRISYDEGSYIESEFDSSTIRCCAPV